MTRSYRFAIFTALALGLAGCERLDSLRPDLRAAERRALTTIEAELDSVEAALAPLPLLEADERRALREHLNAAQLASARTLGVGTVQDSAEVARLAAAGELVRLEDSTEHWVVRELEHSVPYVTPDTRAMLVELGRRFHERLDSLGLPRFRYQITSVLRTSAMQDDLRQGNVNAARGASAHQFGTTVDVAYTEFSAPAAYAPAARLIEREGRAYEALRARVNEKARERLETLASDRAGELEAVLGRVLLAMEAEDKLQPLRERRQAVFHMTVARRYPQAAAPARGPAAE